MDVHTSHLTLLPNLAVGVSMAASSLVANALWRRKSVSLRGLVRACLVAAVGLCLIPVGHVGTVVGAALFSASMSVVILSGSRASASTSEQVRARSAGIWSLMMNASVAFAGPVALVFSVFGPAGPFVWCAMAAATAAATVFVRR